MWRPEWLRCLDAGALAPTATWGMAGRLARTADSVGAFGWQGLARTADSVGAFGWQGLAGCKPRIAGAWQTGRKPRIAGVGWWRLAGIHYALCKLSLHGWACGSHGSVSIY